MSLPFADFLVGIVRVPVANLTFASPGPHQLARSEKSGDVLKLVKVFRETGFSPSRPANQIFGIVSPTTFRSILSYSRLSRRSLLQTVLDDEFPMVKGNFKVLCVEGRRRIQAAQLFLGRDAWWTIKLHCIEQSSISETAIRHHNGLVLHEAPYSDGEIYNSIRLHQIHEDDQSIREWKIMLSDCKSRALDHLIARKDIREALDRVMTFPGLRSGLQLGNIDKHLATHCDELIVHYLDWIYQTWSTIIAKESLRQLLDDDTVRLLQFRVPLASKDDRSFISSSMSSGILFRKVTRPQDRDSIERSLLSIDVVVPTLATFHENMKYITIGARIIMQHLDIVPGRRTLSTRRTTTIYSRLSQNWDDNHRPLMEVSEGRFYPLIGPPSLQLSFKQLFVSVLRQFTSLSTETGLRDTRKEATTARIDPESLRRLFQRAIALGFRNAKIVNQLAQLPIETSPASVGKDDSAVLADWRGGKPFVRTIPLLRENSFLPVLSSSKLSMDIPTPQFIQNDLVTAFFGNHEFFIDRSQPAYSIVGTDEARRDDQGTAMDVGTTQDTAMDVDITVDTRDGTTSDAPRGKRKTKGFKTTPIKPNKISRRVSKNGRKPATITGTKVKSPEQRRGLKNKRRLQMHNKVQGLYPAMLGHEESQPALPERDVARSAPPVPQLDLANGSMRDRQPPEDSISASHILKDGLDASMLGYAESQPTVPERDMARSAPLVPHNSIRDGEDSIAESSGAEELIAIADGLHRNIEIGRYELDRDIAHDDALPATTRKRSRTSTDENIGSEVVLRQERDFFPPVKRQRIAMSPSSVSQRSQPVARNILLNRQSRERLLNPSQASDMASDKLYEIPLSPSSSGLPTSLQQQASGLFSPRLPLPLLTWPADDDDSEL